MLDFPERGPIPILSVRPMTAITSLLLGAALGVAHGLAGLVIARLARGASGNVLATVILGGTALRMMMVLGVVALLLLFSSVQIASFITGLGVTFVIGLIAEVFLLLRHSSATPTRA
ncbi:hypothetical protein [Rubricoccus marinus]|nr:hypothetical protein [Rubricoccus marinus]